MNLQSITVYPTALCNLNCSYCPIAKNNSLSVVDKELKESFLDDGYYLRMLKDLGEDNIANVSKVSFWGGEPTLKLHRTYNMTRQFVDYFHKIDYFFFSTNLCYSNVCHEIEGFIDVLSEFPERKFVLKIQLSIDGPPEITDSARGEGVTGMFMNNYLKLCEEKFYSQKHPNVSIDICYKPTIDILSMKKFKDKTFMKEYYKWFEDTIFSPISLCVGDKLSVNFRAVPNIAIPAPISQEDGKDFAKVCENSLSMDMSDFKYYDSVTMFSTLNDFYDEPIMKTCGVGQYMVDLLPNNIYCGCHRAFLTYCDDYINSFENYKDKKPLENRGALNQLSPFIFNGADEFLEFCNKVTWSKTPTSSFHLSVMTIMYLASLGQIDKKYLSHEKAEWAAKKFSMFFTSCMLDNITSCGSQLIILMGQYRLWLNGAVEIVEASRLQWRSIRGI